MELGELPADRCRTIAQVSALGGRVEVVPGPSAALTALVASGLPTTPFTFVGFLSRQRGDR
ncbi:MAG TPA: hypothetical protein VJY65_10155, partial [Chloroflexota bacterium]|nr:hypothetical protein [Chloroflexota bacterium]